MTENALQSPSKQRTIFYAIWLLISLMQAGFTELFHDEAYYWLYSTEMAWGYFDHPPMVAFLIKLGYSIFGNELGARLLIVLLNTLAIFLLEELIKPEKPLYFYLVVASVAVFHAGFLATPDAPLLFFSASFFWVYKRFLDKPSSLTILLLGLNMSLLLLSKYHGVLVIGFTVLSNLKLLKNGKFWLAALIGIIGFAPHLWWQYENGFPTFMYHLFERSGDKYRFSFTSEYLLGQLFVPGPIIGFLLLYLGFKFKPQNSFDKALKFNLYGIYLFFLFMSFKGRVEAHWTFVAALPLVYTSFKNPASAKAFSKSLKIIVPISLVLLLTARAFLMYNFLPQGKVETEFHGWDEWAKDLQKEVNGLPVAFMNSYQNASKYTFYTGEKAISLNNPYGRRNQFGLWDWEKEMQGEEVILVANYDAKGYDSLQTDIKLVLYKNIENFRTFSYIKMPVEQRDYEVKRGEPFKVRFKFDISDCPNIDLENNPKFKPVVYFHLLDGKRMAQQGVTPIKPTNEMVRSGETFEIELVINEKLTEDRYFLILGIRPGGIPAAISSPTMKVKVLE
ncbi:glycosyltransferase family 39 protein [Flammeovirgaceae bacterium SG7u.111]|nr:glycosyltransferase family 39 protein [Flammeovirgaceae bacterium SG7u.132]WPO34583.1 glycosyltransferase family 39 protein [Flammeovirgaceae bacterium SG7u.111]